MADIKNSNVCWLASGVFNEFALVHIWMFVWQSWHRQTRIENNIRAGITTVSFQHHQPDFISSCFSEKYTINILFAREEHTNASHVNHLLKQFF